MEPQPSSFPPPPVPINHTIPYIVYSFGIIIGISIVVISAIYVFRYFTIIKTKGIITKITCIPNTTKKSLYKCELTITYETEEIVVTVENNVKYNVNDPITVYYPESNKALVSLVDMDYKTLGSGGIAIGAFIIVACGIAIISI